MLELKRKLVEILNMLELTIVVNIKDLLRYIGIKV